MSHWLPLLFTSGLAWAAPTEAPPRPTVPVPTADAIACPKGTTRTDKGTPGTTLIVCLDGQGRRQGPTLEAQADWIETRSFIDGVEDGPLLLMDRDGRVLQRATYVEGLFHGDYAGWRADGGAEVGRYERGKRVGVWSVWSARGILTRCDLADPMTPLTCLEGGR